MFHPHLIGHRVSYGYVLRASAWGKGCASEVMSWLVDHALAHPGIHRAEAFCDVENSASARVMEKAGMVREGILRRFFRHPNISDAPRDRFIYSKVQWGSEPVSRIWRLSIARLFSKKKRAAMARPTLSLG